MVRRVSLLTGVSVALFGLSAPAAAETLRDALVKAYTHNPILTGARAGQRANDENVPIARADGLPSAQASVNYDEYLANTAVVSGGGLTANNPARALTGNVQLAVPIYRGGAVRNAVRAAKTRVEAGAEGLRATEASVFSQTVAAYMDVIRDRAIVELNRENVKVLEVNLQAAKDRFEVGDLTRTDVAQSEARLAIAQSDLRGAQARLIASRESYIKMVGDVPGDLEPPPPLPDLPADPDSAVDVAIAENPDLLAANKERQASGYDINAAQSNWLPRVSAVASGGYNDYLNSIPGAGRTIDTKSATVGVSATIPIFQGGRPGALVRQAQARSGQAIENAIAVERDVVAQTRAAFASWRSSLEVIESSQVAVSANTLSLEGVRAENSVGNRTILDILNAEQELLNAQVQLVSARRDAYVAGFALLAAMGRAEARDLALDGGTALYDPTVHYRRVSHAIWDWDSGKTPQPVATRTVDTPSQNPETAPTPAK
ncbi:TolC family outer membrane protein [Sphingomonas flavalba]|uniref:TolC family outer membrane protein n=1 Tax=Sphingomonas flavalba TaxID=2559804 RepID=UPI0039E158BC